MLSFRCPPECPHWTKGEEFNVEGLGLCGHQCWHSYSRCPDHTGEVCGIWLATTNSTPPLFVLEIASSKLWGYEMGVLDCTLISGTIPLPSTLMPCELLASHARDPVQSSLYQMNITVVNQKVGVSSPPCCLC